MSATLTPKKMKVAELREELEKRGFDTKGLLKNDLVQKLEEALVSNPSPAASPPPSSSPASAPPVSSPPASATTTTPAPAAVSTPAPAAVPAPSSSSSSTADTNGDVSMEDGPKKIKIASTADLNEAKKRRAERFGVPVVESAPATATTAAVSGASSDEGAAKKQKKAVSSEEEIARMKKRAERFGVPVAAVTTGGAAATATTATTVAADPEEEKKRQARAAKFGAATPVLSEEEKAKIAARAAKFQSPPSTEAKKVAIKPLSSEGALPAPTASADGDAAATTPAAPAELSEAAKLEAEKRAKRAAKFASSK